MSTDSALSYGTLDTQASTDGIESQADDCGQATDT